MTDDEARVLASLQAFLPEAADAVPQAGAFVKATHAAGGRDAGRAAS